ncbi:hypothetical protein BC828DRAFT_377229 [Blastocladiella britannica]|nr:hypothetical protein BC828DRAFT_377229 [Blastocladiella britannica]
MVPRAAVNPGWQAHVARASEVRPASDVAVRAGSGSALVNALAGASKLSETESKADRLVASLGAALPLSPEDDVAARSAMLARILGLGSASAAMRNRWNTQRALEMTRRSPSDTGSPEAQAAVLTARINNLKQHLATNKKDKHNERGLTLLMSKRDKLLKYLKRQDLQTYYVTLHQLGL